MRGKNSVGKIVAIFLVAFGLIFNFSSDKANVSENASSVTILAENDETIGGKH